jgi:hypothetical protein
VLNRDGRLVEFLMNEVLVFIKQTFPFPRWLILRLQVRKGRSCREKRLLPDSDLALKSFAKNPADLSRSKRESCSASAAHSLQSVLRGTAHWKGDTFVNDYEGVVNGKHTKMRDVWTDIAPNSHTLTAEYDTGNGVMKPYVVSHDTRQ